MKIRVIILTILIIYKLNNYLVCTMKSLKYQDAGFLYVEVKITNNDQFHNSYNEYIITT
jgi:hypothetical protein